MAGNPGTLREISYAYGTIQFERDPVLAAVLMSFLT